MKVGWPGAEIGLEFVQAPVHVEPRVPRVIAFPHGHGCAPKTVAGYRPVASTFEPFTERAVAHVGRYPVYFLVQLEHALLHRRHLHEPRTDGLVNERRVRPPAVRVGVLVGFLADQDTFLPEVGDDRAVGLKNLHAGIRGYFCRKPGL